MLCYFSAGLYHEKQYTLFTLLLYCSAGLYQKQLYSMLCYCSAGLYQGQQYAVCYCSAGLYQIQEQQYAVLLFRRSLSGRAVCCAAGASSTPLTSCPPGTVSTPLEDRRIRRQYGSSPDRPSCTAVQLTRSAYVQKQ
jgi:hypothetical protein